MRNFFSLGRWINFITKPSSRNNGMPLFAFWWSSFRFFHFQQQWILTCALDNFSDFYFLETLQQSSFWIYFTATLSQMKCPILIIIIRNFYPNSVNFCSAYHQLILVQHSVFVPAYKTTPALEYNFYWFIWIRSLLQ